MKDLLGRLLEILRLRIRDVRKRLRVAIRQREPGALHLHHDPMPAPEGMQQIGHLEIDIRLLPRRQWLRLLPTIAKLRAKRFAAQ